MRAIVGGGILQGASVDLAAGRKAAALARRNPHLEKRRRSNCSSILPLLLAHAGPNAPFTSLC